LNQKPKKRKEVEAVDVPDHRHCEICGRVVPPNERYCSPKCEEKAAKERKSMERFRKIWIAILVAFTIFMVIQILLRLQT
jgi:predicted nucleic acid-binding Zn ribbon protein